MRASIQPSARFRRGAAVVLFGLLLPVFIGFVALSVDVSMIAVAQGQLRTAADAAALAGAQQLASENRVRGATTLTAEISGANSVAQTFARKNKVLNTAPVLLANIGNASSGQIVVGYLDPTNPTSTLNASSSLATSFNLVQVTLNRDAGHGGPVPTIFGQLMGYSGANVTVKSTATAEAFSVSGFKSSGSLDADLLPIVLDKTTWQAMMANTTTDQYTYNASNNTVTSGADGVTESQLYPVANGSPGNWGTINVGVTSNSASVLGAQIRYGITPSQLATFPNSTIALDMINDPPSITFSGDPGISAGIKDDLEAIIGQPRIVPIYDQNGDNGNNAWYRVIAFQQARILSVNFQGNPKYVIIQPCLTTDPTAIAGSAQPWTQGGVVKLFLSR
jgi:Flp pilus assembly protein TadG